MFLSRFLRRSKLSVVREVQTSALSEYSLSLAQGIKEGQRHSLAKAITMIESSKKEHRLQAGHLLEHLAQSGTLKIHDAAPTLRIGIAGPPGKHVFYIIILVY